MSSSTKNKQDIKLFYSYSHRDEKLKKELEKQLRILKKLEIINDWNFRDILAGSEWEKDIKSYLNSAHIILLLVSPDFIDSDYCYDIEMMRAIERHAEGDAIVVPVILRPTLWQKSILGKLQALPKNAKPITKWSNRDEAFLNVAEGIVKLINNKLELNQEKTLNKKVIVIEDDEKWLNRILDILKGLKVLIEPHQKYSKELHLRLGKKDYDLIITDLNLSPTSVNTQGDVLARFAHECNGVPIIMISGYQEIILDLIESSTELKIYNFIAKSTWNSVSFLKTVKDVLGKS